MKKFQLRSILALILLLAINLPFAACGGSTSGKNTPEDDGDGLIVLSKEEFKALFTPVEITTENLLDYFEITTDENGYWLTPKENVISLISRDPGAPGFFCQLTFNGEYEIQYTDENGNIINTAPYENTQTTSSLYSDYRRIQLSPLIMKVIDTKTYDATVKAITDITITQSSQTPYSVCVKPDLTPYYNNIDGEKVVLVTEKYEGAVVSPTAVGYTASGKSSMPVLMEEKNGKASLLTEIDYHSASEENINLFGGFAWFRELIESGYFA